jgi:hypothetical protein
MDDLASMFSPVTAEEIDDAQTSGLVAAASPAEKGPRRPGDFQMLERGLVWRANDQTKAEVLVAGKFEIVAQVRDDTSRSWGLLLRFKSRSKKLRFRNNELAWSSGGA